LFLFHVSFILGWTKRNELERKSEMDEAFKKEIQEERNFF